MAFWDQRLWFERSGERYVFRPMAFSRGYDISESEKDRLVRGLTRLNRRLSFAGLVTVAAIAALLMAGALETATPIAWFILLGILAVCALAAIGLAWRDRLIARVLGGREADIPRLPFGTAIATSRPPMSKRSAVPVLRSVVVLFCLCLAAGDGLVVYLLYRAHEAAQGAGGPGDQMRHGALVTALLSSAGFWVIVVLLNAILIACAILLAREVRRLPGTPDAGPPVNPAKPD